MNRTDAPKTVCTSSGRWTYIQVLTSVAALAVLAVSAFRMPVSYDAFWHLRMGQDWLQLGLSPWLDQYSFTFAQQPISSVPYLFEVLLFKLVEFLGIEPGFYIYKLVCFVLLLSAIVVWLRCLRVSGATFITVVSMVVVLAQLRMAVRPELLSYSLSVWLLILLYKAEDDIRLKTMWPVLLLMTFWSNYHTPIFGYVVLAGFFLDVASANLRQGQDLRWWLNWMVWGLLVLAVGLLTPTATHPLWALVTFSAEWKTLIQEYETPALYADVVAMYALIAITAATLALLLRNKQFGSLLIWLVLTYNAMFTARLVAPAGIIMLCLFARAVTQTHISLPPRWRALTTASTRRFAATICTACALWSGGGLALAFIKERDTAHVLFPSDVVSYMRSAGLRGRVFNAYETGGYLIYSSAPGIQVYIDGRTDILYPPDHFKRHAMLMQDPVALARELQHYAIDYALVRNDPATHATMHATGQMVLDYAGMRYSLFRNNTGNFKLLGLIESEPACWKPEMGDRLATEYQTATKLLAADSAFVPYARLIKDYTQATDQAAFLAQLPLSEQWSDPVRRFIGYRAMETGRYKQSGEFFRSVKIAQAQDLIAGAYAAIKAGNATLATQTLVTAARVRWPGLQLSDLQLMRSTLWALQTISPLNQELQTFADGLDVEINRASSERQKHTDSSQLFCARSEG